MNPVVQLKFREDAHRLGLFGLLAHWQEIETEPWLAKVIDFENSERSRRGLERRIRNAKLGDFKPMSDFDWAWPKNIDRDLVEELFQLEFLVDGTNIVIVGPSGVGKTTIAQNLAHQAIIRGHAAHFISASNLLNDLAAQPTGSALLRRLKRYARPPLLVIDELGILGSTTQYADLLFEVINRRYLKKTTILTTNKPFQDWGEIFPNSSCLVALIDRLVHRAEIVKIEGESYRVKEAKERALRNEQRRTTRRKKPVSS